MEKSKDLNSNLLNFLKSLLFNWILSLFQVDIWKNEMDSLEHYQCHNFKAGYLVLSLSWEEYLWFVKKIIYHISCMI